MNDKPTDHEVLSILDGFVPNEVRQKAEPPKQIRREKTIQKPKLPRNPRQRRKALEKIYGKRGKS